jgi:heme exporter protein B
VIGVLASLWQPLPVDPSPVDTPTIDWAAEAPLLVLVGGALVLMLVSAFVRSRRSTVGYTVFTCLVAVGAIGASLTLSLKRGGLLVPLIILPLLSPVVIFGAGAVALSLDGLASANALGLLAAFAFAAMLLSPFAAAASVRLNLGR